ncbi:MAG: flagellar hook-basal body protein [Defluviitaleaceae bacterium]|nr:flagellar hook-basal body protein [Defluviitaleaceae bacterium]
MIRGLYTSALGMTTQMQRMDVVSNNIANVNTTSFKRDAVAAQAFTDRLGHRLNDPAVAGVMRLMGGGGNGPIGSLGQGVFIDEVFTDFVSGGIRETGGPLDLALIDAGFFALTVTNQDGTQQEQFSRAGAFTLSADGTLIDMAGAIVQSVGGAPITVPVGIITIDQAGQVFSNEEYVDTIRIVNFENPESLRKTRGSYWIATEESEMIDFAGTVQQGFLENSNVSAVREMVELIALSRAYEANARLVQLHDETLGRAVNEIARR